MVLSKGAVKKLSYLDTWQPGSDTQPAAQLKFSAPVITLDSRDK